MAGDSSAQSMYVWSNQRNQYYATVIVSLISLCHGLATGWIAPALAILKSDNSPIDDGRLGNEQISWLGSINYVGSICGGALFGYIAANFGCKRAIQLLSIPGILCWLLTIGNTYHAILVSRFFCGVNGGGMHVTTALYISEIASNEIRGKLTSITFLFRLFGTSLAFIIGAYVEFRIVPYLFLPVPVLFAILFALLPNTPQYLLRTNQSQKAEESLKYYKCFKGATQQEIDALQYELDRLKVFALQQNESERVQFKDFGTRQAIKGMIIGISLGYMAIFTGAYVITSYAVIIFEETGTSIDPFTASIVLSIIQILGCLCSTQFSDKLGRKVSLLLSLVGSAIGSLSLAFYLQSVDYGFDLTAYAWLPVLSLSFIIFIVCSGIFPLLSVCTVENLPTKLRGTGLSLCSITEDLGLFILLKQFPYLMETIKIQGCFMIFGISCLLGSVFIYFIVAETKGQVMETMEKKPVKNAA